MTVWQDWKQRNPWLYDAEDVGVVLLMAILSPILLLLAIWYWLNRGAYGRG